MAEKSTDTTTDDVEGHMPHRIRAVEPAENDTTTTDVEGHMPIRIRTIEPAENDTTTDDVEGHVYLPEKSDRDSATHS